MSIGPTMNQPPLTSDQPPDWKHRDRPPRLERRLDFANYEQTRDFLDAVARLSEASGYFPDMSFGRTYVNITIHAGDGATEIDPERVALAHRIGDLVAPEPA